VFILYHIRFLTRGLWRGSKAVKSQFCNPNVNPSLPRFLGSVFPILDLSDFVAWRSRGRFYQHFYKQPLLKKIPTAQKDREVIPVFLRFWDLHLQKLLVKCWWNGHYVAKKWLQKFFPFFTIRHSSALKSAKIVNIFFPQKKQVNKAQKYQLLLYFFSIITKY